MDILNTQDKLSCGIGKGESMEEKMTAIGQYHVECRDAQGNLKWEEKFDNLVTTVGKNILLDIGLGTTSKSAGWYVGLKGTGAANAADTMSSHATWSEIYSGVYAGARPTATFSGAASNGVKTMSTATFTITGSSTIYGCFIADNSTAGGTTGTLYSAGDFAASKAVSNGDTLNVSYSTTLS
jgi:hypothetical protein